MPRKARPAPPEKALPAIAAASDDLPVLAAEAQPKAGYWPSDERSRAWERLIAEVEHAGFPRPELHYVPAPLEQAEFTAEALPAEEFGRRCHDHGPLMQEADWFLRDLDLSLSEVPHFIALRDADRWLLEVRGDEASLAILEGLGFAPGRRAWPGWLPHPCLRRDNPPMIHLYPASQPSQPGWTVIAITLRRPPEGMAGTIACGFCDRRSSTRIFSMLYSAVAAIERQILWSDRLAQADRLSIVGTMISQIVHEVKNPLAAMKAALQLAKHGDGAERDECLQLLHKEIDELNTLVENLLSLAKPTPPRFALQCLEVILSEVLGLVRYEADLRMVRIDFRPGRIASFLRCDAHLLKQAFLNIARNAVQAMPSGGVLRVAVQRRPAKAGVIVEISDTGVGIPPEHLPHLFEPFFSTKEIGGTGLGLSVTRRTIEGVHLGQIRVESIPGSGTRFQILLPFNPEPSAAAEGRA